MDSEYLFEVPAHSSSHVRDGYLSLSQLQGLAHETEDKTVQATLLGMYAGAHDHPHSQVHPQDAQQFQGDQSRSK